MRTFGEPADWLHCIRPAGMNSVGVIVGSCEVEAHTEGGFIFDGSNLKLYSFDGWSFGFRGVDDANYAFGCATGAATNAFFSARVGSSDLRAMHCRHLDCIDIRTVTGDGHILGDALFLKRIGKSRGFYGGLIAKHLDGEIQPFDSLQLAENIATDLRRLSSSLREIDRRHLRVEGRNAAGTFLISAVRVGPNLESVPILLDKDGSMRFGLGAKWRESTTGSESAVMGDDGSFTIQAQCGVPPSHTVYWIDPNEVCEKCGRQRHAVFVSELRGRRSVSPEICACLDPPGGPRSGPDSRPWTYTYYGPAGSVQMNANWKDIWIGEIGSIYSGPIGARPEGAGFGAIWRRLGDKFHFALLNDLVENLDHGMVLGGVAINGRGQIACRVVLRNGGYVGARLGPV